MWSWRNLPIQWVDEAEGARRGRAVGQATGEVDGMKSRTQQLNSDRFGVISTSFQHAIDLGTLTVSTYIL